MFNQKKYINDFNKKNYHGVKLRIRKDDRVVLSKISKINNVNKYIRDLIYKDALANKAYNYINNNINIDFELTKTMQQLVDKAEEADFLNDYGLYMNIADAIDSQAKKETSNHLLRESEWKKLTKRYSL